MDAYARIARSKARDLRPLDRAREDALRHARDLTRLAGELMRGLHAGAWDAAKATRMEGVGRALRSATDRHAPLADHGAVVQAWGEYAEAHMLKAFLEGHKPPALKIPAASYLQGMADLVGELRRVTLARLLADDVAGASRAFDSMEKVYEALLNAQAPERIAGLRPKLDQDRALVERTRGELVTSKRSKELERKIEGVGRLLDEAETPRPKRLGRKPGDDALDLDAAWNKD